MLRQETLTLITTLTPSLPALRQIMLAEQVFCVSTTVQLLVRTWFRQLTPMGRGVQQVLSLLPNSRLDGREFLVFKGKAYGFRYYINGQRHGVSKRWKVGVCGHASGLRSDLGCYRNRDQLDYVAHYHYGKLHGTCIEWGYNSQIYRIRDWEHGVPKDSYLRCISQPRLERDNWRSHDDFRTQVGYIVPEILRERLVQCEMDDAPDVVTLS